MSGTVGSIGCGPGTVHRRCAPQHTRAASRGLAVRGCSTTMMEVTQALQDGEFSKFLNALLSDGVFPGQSPRAVQKSSSLLSSQTIQHSGEEGIRWLQGAEGAQQGSQRYPLKSRGTRSNNDNKGNKGMRRQVQQLEQYVIEQQEKLRQQLHRNLYLTGRVAILEQFIELRATHERRVAEVREGGLSYNPFASWAVSIQEYAGFKPSQVVQKYNYIVQCFAKRLAAITPLLQKYPQLITHRPPADLLQQMVVDLSLAEPTNRYGADGLPVGSLTAAVPEKVIQTLAAAYQLDLASMSDTHRAMLDSCATLIVEEQSVSQTCQHSFMNPEVWHSGAVHLSEVAATPSWEALNSSLSTLRAEVVSNQGSTYGTAHTTIATEAHWKDVAAQLSLTNKQRLEAATAYEVILAAKVTVQSHRAQLAHHLLQLSNPSGSLESPKSPSPSAPFTITDPLLRSQPQAQSQHQQQQQRQEGVQSSPNRNLKRAGSSESATAAYGLSSEQLTQQEVLMRRLEHTVAQEKSLAALTMSLLWVHIMSPVQMAKAVVHSYPYMPRHLDILAACAAECTPAVMDALVAETEGGRGF